MAEALTAVCPDGESRYYSLADGKAWVHTPGGSVVSGVVEDGKFKPDAQHHGAHRMWYPAK